MTEIYTASPRAAFNLGVGLRLTGTLGASWLERALEELVRRHEVLRTRIIVSAEGMRQQIAPAGKCLVETIELQRADGDGREEAQAFFQRAFAEDCLFRVGLASVSAMEHVLVIAMDHLIGDRQSLAILLRELCELYKLAADGVPLHIPGEPLQYADYAVWQESLLRRCDLEAYWRDRLAGAKALRLEPERGMEGHTPGIEALSFELGASLTSSLRKAALQENATVAMALLCVFVALVACWCGVSTVVIPVFHMGRNVSCLSGSIGYFAHPVYLRVEVPQRCTYRDLLARVMDACVTACEHEDFGMAIASMRQFARGSWFHYVPMEPSGPGRVSEIEGLNIERIPLSPLARPFTEQWAFDFGITFQGGGSVAGALHYRADCFRPQTMERVREQILMLCEKFVRAPEGPVPSVAR